LNRIGNVLGIEVNEREGVGGASLHAGGEQTFVNAFPAHAAFFHMAFCFVVAWRTKWTVAQAVTAANASILVMDNDAIFAFGVCSDWAAFKTGRIIAMVAG